MGNYTIWRGNSLVLDEQVRNPDGTIPNIADYASWFVLKHNTVVPDGEAVWIGEVGAGITYTDAPNGRLRVVMPARTTDGFPDGDVALRFALNVRDPDGVVTTVDEGTVTVRPNAARSAPPA